MTTAKRMKLRRKELGMSAEFVADKLGCSPATIYRYEKGDIEKMPMDILSPLATILCTTPAYLMGWETEKPSADHSEELPYSDMELLSAYKNADSVTQELIRRALGLQ